VECEVVIVDKYHPVRAPTVIIIMGTIFIVSGMMDSVEEIGLIHARSPPEIVASEARNSIGLMIGISSVMCICGAQFDVLHMVTTLKRME
jgi:uncharacterized membrane protein